MIDDLGVVVWTRKTNAKVHLQVTGRMREVLLRVERDSQRYLWPRQASIYQDPASAPMLSVQFGRLCKEAGIEGKTFHCLRSSFIMAVEERDGIGAAMLAAGHANEKTTRHYLRPLPAVA